MKELIDYLNAIHPLSPELQEHLLQILKTRKLHKKEYLLKAGHICRNICFIQSGLLRCFYSIDNKEVNSWFMKEGDIIVSVESFFDQKASYESIQALEETQLFCIEHAQLEHIYHTYPEFNYVARVLLQKYYKQSEQRLYSLRMKRSQERYDYLMKHFPELILRVPAKHLATYIGMAEETVSRIRSQKLFS
ncbi:MAG: Crp/Fnr family transcriptional regulator [Bacteroidota bacterium]|nr:Crp/Fnr family transcriptional regulator [Bacteroidota bacterium]